MSFYWNATAYHQHSQFQYDHALAALSKYAFKPDDHVLDVGCGDGKITFYIANQVSEGVVLGIDNASSMISFAQKNYGEVKPNLNFKVESAESFDYTNQFNLIVSFACLHWVKDQAVFLQNAKKSLKNNGKMILNLYPKHHLIWDAINDAACAAQWSSYFIDYTNPHISYDKETYQNLVIKAGLTVISIKEEIPIATFPTLSSAESFIRSWLPHTELLEPHLKDAFIHDILKRYLKSTSQNNNNIEIPFYRLDIQLTN